MPHLNNPSLHAYMDRHKITEPEDFKKPKEDQGFKIRNITSLVRERSPVLMTILLNERDEFQVFVVAPWSSLHFGFVTTWRSSFAHFLYSLSHTLLSFLLPNQVGPMCIYTRNWCVILTFRNML